MTPIKKDPKVIQKNIDTKKMCLIYSRKNHQDSSLKSQAETCIGYPKRKKPDPARFRV